MSKSKQALALEVAGTVLAREYPNSEIGAVGRRFTITSKSGKTEIVYVRYSSQHPDPDGGFNFSKLKSRPGEKVGWLVVWFAEDANASHCRVAMGSAKIASTKMNGSYFRVLTDGIGNIRGGPPWKQVNLPGLAG